MSNVSGSAREGLAVHYRTARVSRIEGFLGKGE
jgi:hypothetical protein